MTVRAHPTRLGSLSIAIAVAVTLVTILVATALGPIGIAPFDVAEVLLGAIPGIDLAPDVAPTTAAIVTEVRFPRVLLAALVGAVLACAGGAYQATFHNPLADPYSTLR